MLNGKEGRLLRRNNDKDANMKINILLCDDDKDFLQRISDTVAGQPVPPGASICITKSSNPAEITDRQLSQYHIMFLDIDMDERSGMDIARRVRELHLDTVIIFVTNYPEFSMEGYEVRAFRYLLKQELEQKLPNYFRDALAELPRDDKVLRFSANAESFNIPYKDILYLESNQRVIYLYTVKPMQAPDRFYGKMEDLAAELEGDGFLRIQKSYLVNMAYIKKFNYDRVVLFDGKELSVSEKRYSQMKVQYLSWKNKNWGNRRCTTVYPGAKAPGLFFVKRGFKMNYRQDHPAWIYVRCASVNAATAFDRLYDLIDEAAGHGFLVRGTSFDHCSGNTLKDRNGLRAMLDAVENNLVEAVIVRDLEQISRNNYLLVGVIEIFRRRDVYLITTECDLNAELINCGLERFVGDRFTRASFGKPRFDVRLPLMDQF